MPNQADVVIKEYIDSTPMTHLFRIEASAIYGENYALMEIGYAVVIDNACKMRRAGYAKNRAEAIEFAFDFILQKGLHGSWERVGEPAILRMNNIPQFVQALCRKLY